MLERCERETVELWPVRPPESDMHDAAEDAAAAEEDEEPPAPRDVPANVQRQ